MAPRIVPIACNKILCSMVLATLPLLLLLVAVAVVEGFQVEIPSVFHGETTMTSRMAATTARRKMTQLHSVPKLIVLDLDNTAWSPELYQLRRHQRSGRTPVAHHDVKLLPGAATILENHRRFLLSSSSSDDDESNDYLLADTKFAIASRTKSVDWAHDLLDQFDIRHLFDYVEIFPGHKRQHFGKIADASGIPFRDMLFFDDARDGKYGNCLPVAEMGVLSVHCPNGLVDERIFERGLERYREWDGASSCIVEWDGTVTRPYLDNSEVGERSEGTVKYVNPEKRFGFIRPDGNRNSNDVFFHFSSLPMGQTVQQGDKLTFSVERDPKNGKNRASDITISTTSTTTTTTTNNNSNGKNKPQVTLPTFSMNMPFAALLANGYKTLESRNGTMFVKYPEGTRMLLHVGRRTYPDGDKHLEVMKSGGLDDAEIERLKSLPAAGFQRGMVVAICEIGATYETTLKQRCDPDFQRKVAAFGEDSGRRATEIKRVAYLKRPVKMPAQGGVFDVSIDADLLPDGWRIDPDVSGSSRVKAPDAAAKKSSGKQPLYSISG